jgi:ribosomal protein S18 acetylase RimI-like enzyme
VEVRPLTDGDREWVAPLIVERWGSSFVVGRGRTWTPADLPGFAAFDSGRAVGLVTYEIEDDACEIVTIDAFVEGVGIGTALLEAVTETARSRGCSRMQLVTTNNNLTALAFYQKRGFRLVRLVPGALDEARKVKPTIPLVDSQGRAIRDELQLELPLM